MLLQCPECELPVSDKALTCPHCGYPLQTSQQNFTPRKNQKKKRMRLPNGFGRITELKGRKLRKPFRAMVTTGFDEDGKPIGKIYGYYETYNDAYAALVEYHKNPVDLDNRITVAELYEKWTAVYFEQITPNATRGIKAAWAYCSEVYHLSASELRARHIKHCIENARANINGEERLASAGTKSRMKSLFNLMLDFAVEYEIVDKNYARTFDLSKDIIVEKETATRQHLSFKDEELLALWNSGSRIANIILIQCYTGWRPQELGLIELKNVDLENMTMIGGMKTDAGTDRIVPIHSRIQEIVKKIYHESELRGSIYLITDENGKKLTYDKYRHRFDDEMVRLSLNSEHRPHDGRKTFVTLAKKYNVSEYAIKRIIGHNISDLTERVYTDRDISWLSDELRKIE